MVTDEVVRKLRAESGEAGDLDMVAICDVALQEPFGGAMARLVGAARERCAEVVAEAKAVEDEADRRERDIEIGLTRTVKQVK